MTGKHLLACLATFALFFSCISLVHGESSVVRVGVFDIEPLSFMTDKETYDGLAINILEHIAEDEDFTLQYVPCSFVQCLELLESGDIDLQSIIAYTDERAKKYDYTGETIFNDWSEVYTRPGINVESILDLDGKRVAILKNAVYYRPFIRLVESFDVNVSFIKSENYENVFNLVQNNKADVLVVNRLFALRKAHLYKVDKTPIIFSPIDIRFAVPKNKNQELLNLLDKHLKEFKKDRESLYYESIERLFGGEHGKHMPLWHYWVLYSSLGLIGLFMVISLIFRAQVKKRTLDLRKELHERSRVEQEVFQGKRDWEETFDTITDIITIHDKDFTIIRANKAASLELNMPWDQICKAKCFEYYHGTDCPPDSCASCQSLKSGEATTVEMFEPHMNKFLEIRAIPRKDRNGNIVGLIHVVRDITERRRAFEALKESESKNRTLLENIPQKIFYKNSDSIYISCNKAFAEDFGMSEKEIEGKTDFDFFPRELAEKYISDDRRIIESGVTEEIEESYETDGLKKVVFTTKSPVKDDSGNITGILGVFHDITEQKQAEEALRESENKYRTLVDSSLVGIFRTNVKGEILFINDAMVNLLGYDSPEDIMQRNIIEIYENPEDRDDLIDIFRQDGRIDDYELTGIKKNGEKITLLVSSTLDGEIISGMLIDITQRKHMERTAHLASIGELAAGVAHEINNPTNSVINYAQVMQDRLSSDTKEGDYAGRIIKEGNRIAVIVKGLLSFARGTSGEKTFISIEDVLNEALLLTKAHFRKSNINIKLDIEFGLPKVMANHQQIEQVFLNVLSNAQFALNEKLPGLQEGKEVLITGDIDEQDGHKNVRMTFHDNGVGMSQENLRRASAPFFTTKPTGRGTGLGLSISHGIINDHNGNLKIESHEGEFTAVTIEFPVKD